MQFARYLQHIGFDGNVRPDRETLTALLQAHVCKVPFENLDVQLGTPLSTDVASAYEKIVERQRGGWCYEQNSLFGWALEQTGFTVTRVAASVIQPARGDASPASHLCLLIEIPGDEKQYLADVGFGGSMFEPLPLVETKSRQTPFELGLAELSEGRWRFSERAHDEPSGYDFESATGDEAAMAAKCFDLQTSPESTFVLNAFVQRRTPQLHYALRGRVLTTTSLNDKQQRLVNSADEYVNILATTFGLDLPAAKTLWPRIVERHVRLGLPATD